MGKVSKTEILLDFQGLSIPLFIGSLNKHLLRVSYTLGFLDGTSGKEPACRRHKRCRLDPQVRKIPWRKAWKPTPVLLPRKPHGRRSLVQATAHEVAKSRTGLSDFTFFLSYWLISHTEPKGIYLFLSWGHRNSLAVQWLGLCPFTAMG